MVPSLFEPLKFYCIYIWEISHGYHVCLLGILGVSVTISSISLQLKSYLTLKAPNKTCTRQQFNFFTFIFRRKYGLIFHVNSVPMKQ